MAQFYTQYGWEGHNYSDTINAKEVAKRLREYIKNDDDLKRCKWSVTVRRDIELNVALMEAPFDVFKRVVTRGYLQNANNRDYVTPECLKVLEKVQAFVLSYIHSDTDAMIDYFDRNIYDWYNIGKWDKPFKRIA